jgi:hypothetical protein
MMTALAFVACLVDLTALFWMSRQTPEQRKVIYHRALRFLVWAYVTQAACGFVVGLALPWLFLFHVIGATNQ